MFDFVRLSNQIERLEFDWVRFSLVPRPVRAIRVTRGGLEPSANFPDKLDRWRHIRNRRGRLGTRLGSIGFLFGFVRLDRSGVNSVQFFLSTSWWLDGIKDNRVNYPRKCFWKKKKKPRLNLALGLVLIGLRTTGPRYFAEHLRWVRLHAVCSL